MGSPVLVIYGNFVIPFNQPSKPAQNRSKLTESNRIKLVGLFQFYDHSTSVQKNDKIDWSIRSDIGGKNRPNRIDYIPRCGVVW